MPPGYVVTVLLLAWGTWCTVTPVHWRPGGKLRYLCSLQLSELPVLGIYLLAADTALSLALGDVTNAGGVAAVVVAGIAAGALLVVARRQWSAGEVTTAALARDLDIPRPRPASRAVLVLPRSSRRLDIAVSRNLAYGDMGRSHLLDVYRRRSGASAAPVFVHLHGGAFRSGSKMWQARPLLYGLARRGWVCVSANYRLAPHASRLDALEDVKRLVAWVRANVQEYGGSPDRILLGGSSAGAHLAALAALTPDEPRFQPGFEAADTSVAAAVCLYGLYGPEFFRGPDANVVPLTTVRPDAPPFLVAHGDRDSLLPATEAHRFVTALRQVSQSPVVYVELPGAQHGFDTFRSIRADNLTAAIATFEEARVRTAG